MADTPIAITYKCCKCGRTMGESNFYTYRNGSKCEMCKACLTMHIDNFDESTYVWILEKLDVAYIPEEWNILRDRAYARSHKLTGLSVMGRYLSFMRLKQYATFGYMNSMEAREVFLNSAPERCAPTDPDYEAEMKKKLELGEISEAQYRTLVSTATQRAEDQAQEMQDQGLRTKTAISSTFYDESQFMSADELPDPAEELTQDDKIYLAMKWGRLYKPNEWVELEKKYKEMKDSFEIVDSDTEGTLILICKTFLKMNQAVDEGDMDGFQKLSRVYDTLRKSAKFTAAQKKETDVDFVTSVGELVDYCEKTGGAIPKFQIEEPLDKIDKIIDDLKEYNKSLIYSDPTLATQIEDYLKQRSLLDQKRAERDANNGIEPEVEITEQDYLEYSEQIQQDLLEDKEVYNEQ